MKKLIVSFSMFFLAIAAFSQQEENGTIYIKHPYIDAVMKAGKAYQAQDLATLKTLYSDTARFWSSGMEKFIPIADAYKLWMTDFDYFDSITQKQSGYPDYLHYKDEDAKTVQSWWTLSGKSKKTGELVKIPIVIFDNFNTAGKIVSETIYGDFSKWVKE